MSSLSFPSLGGGFGGDGDCGGDCGGGGGCGLGCFLGLCFWSRNQLPSSRKLSPTLGERPF